MRVVLWTEQAHADLAAIRAFIGHDSPHYDAALSGLVLPLARIFAD